jgi:dolichyl-phosphate-mannose-protein mannosyltransferase
MLLQDLIHRLELGGGMRYVRVVLSVLALLVVLVGYNWRAFRNMSTQEGMDAAQLGRNLAEGRGYTTLFIRPLSICLVKKNRPQPDAGTEADPAQLKRGHPDLANPPVYPVLLAGLMKALPFNYKIPAHAKPSFWTSAEGQFRRYEPDFLISLFNQALFLVMTLVVFFIARRLFDSSVAWVSAILILLTELFWRFAVSGLSTILLLLIFAGLVWCLMSLDEEVRAPKRGLLALLVLAALAGACVGLGGLTRYAFGWLIIPVLLFLSVYGACSWPWRLWWSLRRSWRPGLSATIRLAARPLARPATRSWKRLLFPRATDCNAPSNRISAGFHCCHSGGN